MHQTNYETATRSRGLSSNNAHAIFSHCGMYNSVVLIFHAYDFCYVITVFENHRKSFIQNCERSELCLHFEWTKVDKKCQKWSFLASFWKLMENAKILKFKCDIMRNFQTMCKGFQFCLWFLHAKYTLYFFFYLLISGVEGEFNSSLTLF